MSETHEGPVSDDPAVICELYWREHRKYVYGRLLTLSKNPHLAEDLTVETYTRLLRHLRNGRPVPVNPQAWLILTANRIFIDHVRLASSRNEESRDEIRHGHYVEDFDSVELRQQAQELLAHLPPKQRRVMELRDFADLPTKVVAEILNMSDQAVRSARHKAVRTLRELRKESEVHDDR